jgi:putative peptide zinc metalloprotease protein
MNHAATSSGADQNRATDPALPPLRNDLEVTERQAAGRVEYVLKDPLANRFFRVGEVEWFVARLLDGRRTAGEVLARAREQFPATTLDEAAVRHFVRQLALTGMLRLNGRVDIERLLAERKTSWAARILSLPSRIFYIRVPLVNPDAALTRWLPLVRSVLRPWAAVLCTLLVLAAALLAVWQADRFAEPQAEFLTPAGLAWLLAALVAVKVVHELAHAAVCKHLGGRVPEMGLVLIVFTPCLYCDVSDAWTMPSRRRRLAVTAAGIAVELALAAAAMIVFLVTRPGWLHQASFSVMVTASLSTLFFNGNPLLRYDGYYLLSDLIEVPNLRLRAQRYVVGLARQAVFGRPLDEADRPERRRGLLAAYAVASYLYGWFVLYAILVLAYRHLESYGLQALAAALIVTAALMQVGVPVWRLTRALARMIATRGNTRQFIRPAAIAAALGLAVGLLLAVPVDDTLTRSCVVRPAEPTDVQAPQAGLVREVRVRAGQAVKEGQTLLVMDNPELAHSRNRAGFDVAENQLLLSRVTKAAVEAENAGRTAEAKRWRGEQQKLEVRAAQLATAQADAQAKVDALCVTAPRDGVVLTEAVAELGGRYVEQGATLMTLGRPGETKVSIELSEQAAERVGVGSVAEVRVPAAPEQTFRGRIVSKARAASAQTAAVLTTQFGGDVPVRATTAGWQTAERVYGAEMEVDDGSTTLRPNMSGKARVYLGRRSLGSWLWQAVEDELSLDVLLQWR